MGGGKPGKPSDHRRQLGQWHKWEVIPFADRAPNFHRDKPFDMIRRLTVPPQKAVSSIMELVARQEAIIEKSQAKENDLYHNNAYGRSGNYTTGAKKESKTGMLAENDNDVEMAGQKIGYIQNSLYTDKLMQEYECKYNTLFEQARAKIWDIEMLKMSVKRLEEHNTELIWTTEDLKNENLELKKRVQELIDNEVDNCWP